jgi:adenosine deaminase
MSIEAYLQHVPKVEIHVHLEGSIQPQTLLTLAERNRVDLPARTPEEFREWFTFRDFQHFLEVYVAITRCLKREEDYELLVVDTGRELVRQNVKYAEITFSPGTHRALGIADETFLRGLSAGRARVLAEFGVRIGWVFDIVRDAPMERAEYTTDVAIAYKDEGVVALGLGGKEEGHPARDFTPLFERALAAGLHSDPHAGEHVGPSSVWEAVRDLHAERIGHGVRSIEDPALVAHLAERGIPLEINPTSNIRLGVYPDYASHPFRRLHEAGVIVTVNSDDPPLFNTTLNEEVALLRRAFGFEIETIDEILLNAARHSFLGAEDRKALEAAMRGEMAELHASAE